MSSVYKAAGKRTADIVFALIAIVLFLPLLVILFLVIVLTEGSPALFRQLRPGLDARPFIIIKFRTMRQNDGECQSPASDYDRLTTFGKLLRRTSLDELPGLWNVLKGEMSIIGPRPLLMEYVSLYSEEQNRRHNLRPGITGWAQIHGRNTLSWNDKFSFDSWYVDNLSFWLDLKILALTLAKVVRQEGINKTGQTISEKFIG